MLPDSEVPELPAAPSACPGTSSRCGAAASNGGTTSHSVRMTRCIFRVLCAPQRTLAVIRGVGSKFTAGSPQRRTVANSGSALEVAVLNKPRACLTLGTRPNLRRVGLCS